MCGKTLDASQLGTIQKTCGFFFFFLDRAAAMAGLWGVEEEKEKKNNPVNSLIANCPEFITLEQANSALPTPRPQLQMFTGSPEQQVECQ